MHRYDAAIIAVEELSAEFAAERLREGTCWEGEGGSAPISLPAQGDVVPQWVDSAEQWALTESGWPRLVVSARGGDSAYVDPLQPLRAVEMPFFPSLGAAVAERVFRVPPTELRLGQHPTVLVRIAERRGRIAAVETHEGEVRVVVEEGREGGLDGFLLRAAWRPEPGSREWERSDHTLDGPGPVELETGGVPAELVVALVDSLGFEIDRRSWDEQFGRPMEEPGSLEGLVARWLGEGEHGQLEYKQTLKEQKTRVSFAETVAAFANGAGGALLLGVNDEGAVVGYGPEKAKDLVTNTISELVVERPNCEVVELDFEGKPIIVVRVAASAPQSRPHQVKGRTMVRAIGTTRPATPAEIRELTAPALSPLDGFAPPINGRAG
jgi:hypothetical protein